MSSERNIKMLDPKLGEKPCAKSSGHWRRLTENLAVCDLCDDPPVSCYAKPADYQIKAKQED
jgi:hypothetical protein